MLESLLLELDRHGYVDWMTVTRTGAHVWDCSESADRIGAAIATAVADRLASCSKKSTTRLTASRASRRPPLVCEGKRPT
ncbi:hypothetical protein C487_14734 [Natrinema pallidum DSM 3751]|uniref:Uncharacterized protein n=1 Tax=Natrinema pallidum DSM 3751 TaxID=1227495 RepID=L9YLQ2_9EURY|nr:hypothetical protein C487_14734 [Natrinema pallidum DSM 3751]